VRNQRTRSVSPSGNRRVPPAGKGDATDLVDCNRDRTWENRDYWLAGGHRGESFTYFTFTRDRPCGESQRQQRRPPG